MGEKLDERTLHELEEVLQTKIYPGTEIMKDVGSHHFVKGKENVLIPQPSDDPHDPLNWSTKWKMITMFCATMLSFSQNFGPLSLAPLFEEFVHEWGHSLADNVQLTGVTILVLGFSNFLWVPISVCFGRRPVTIISTVMCVVASIWRAQATSYESFLGACALGGIAAGPSETLQPQVIADMIFLHERGKYQTLYFVMYLASLMIAPTISGAMTYNIGWRSFWWLNTGLLLFSLILSIFLFPETRYHRKYKSDNEVVPPLAGGVKQETEVDPKNTSHDEGHDVEPVLSNREEGLAHIQTPQDPWLGRGKPGKAQFKLWQPYEGSFLREIWLPWYLFTFPIVQFSSFLVSFPASAALVVSLSEAQAFAAPPYNYTPQTIGLFNLAVLIGGLLGLFTNGPWSDWVAAYLTRRNNGIREPEMRLPAMIPYMLLLVLGSVVMAVGYDNYWPWQAIVIVGYGALGMQVAAIPSIASTYGIDSYKPVTGSLFVTITVNKNIWGYGLSKFLTPWAAESGFMAPILVNMALIMFFCLTGIIFWFWGKKFRGMTKDSFVHKL